MRVRLELDRLGVRIAGKQVVEDFSAGFEGGRCIGILGGNGVGKTTLLHTIAGLREQDAGQVRINGQATEELGRRQLARQLALLMQQYDDPFPASVLETALIGRHPHIDFWQWESPEDIELARQALQATGMAELEQRDVHALSGGERRRLAIATILAQDTQIYLLDEPVDQLDLLHQMRLLGRFRELAREHDRLVLMSLHDVNHAARFCDDVLLMYGNGEVVLDETYKVLNPANLERLYGIPVRMITTDDALFFQPEWK
ncbi:MAG: ABC transporter ATP-binding protein [Gammaproteobacteria bacterium]|nr:ABC transporter ATP-binding protein [Gammaproteobacteria bacterium]